MEPERRRASRRKALKSGRVVLSGSTTVDCLVRDLSEEGARLKFGGLIDLPKAFDLLLVSERVVRAAEVTWRRGEVAGIRFTGPAREAAAGLHA